MFSLAGLEGNPGIVIMLPSIATTKPAPALSLNSLTGSVNPLGAPNLPASWDNDYCVLAMQTGRFP